LKNLGINEFQIDINNTRLFSLIKDYAGFNDDEYQEFMDIIKKREIFNLKNFVSSKNLDKEISEFLVNIPKYQGQRDI